MEVNNCQFDLSDCKTSADNLIVEEKKLLKQLHEEAVLCSNNEHTEDEITAAIGMMLMHYQAVAETQNTPKNKPITSAPVANIHHQQNYDSSATKPQSPTKSLHGVQMNSHIDTIKQQTRKNRKSNSSKSSLLASCRNILKEFLSQNSF